MIRFHLAWVDDTDTVFDQAFARDDENVLAFSLDQQEGDFAELTIEVINPIEGGHAKGLLSPGRKQHVWLSYDDGETGDAAPMFFGRLVAVPTSIFKTVVELKFTARPSDLNAQKAALADSLKVLPWYDEIFIDEAHRADPDVALEARSAVWHFDPITHQVTISDILVGEDGVEEFQPDEMLFDGLELDLGTPPLSKVTVTAELPWTQLAKGSGVDLTAYMLGNWPNEPGIGGVISSFTMTADNWPKNGAAMGDGWVASLGSCIEKYDLTIKSATHGLDSTIHWPDGDTTHVTYNKTDAFLTTEPPGSFKLGGVTTTDTVKITRSKATDTEPSKITSYNRNLGYSTGIVPLHHLNPVLQVGYDAARPFTENVSLTLTADMQAIVTLPADDEPEIIALRSVNLSEPLSPGTTAQEIPIVDPRRRSYITTDRGLRSIEYMILRARATLLMRARAVGIVFVPYARTVAELDRIVGLSLRHSALIHDWRIPGGEASGKVAARSIALNGDTGVLECSVRLGCPIGKGGEATVIEGTGLYVDAAAMGPDLQEFEGRQVLIDTDTSVGYAPPPFNPNDDGVDFLSTLTAADIIETDLTVENPPATQRYVLDVALEQWKGNIRSTIYENQETANAARQEILNDRGEAVNAALETVPTIARFKLKSMKRAFSTDHVIAVTDLKIPTGINLEAP